MAGAQMADAARPMKRFYTTATIEPGPDGLAILLDGKPVKTPAKAPLLLPGAALADAVAAEWNAQGDKIAPRTMKLTGLANAAIDRIGPERDSFVRALAAYGESDLLCYRAEAPAGLVQCQAALWDPPLAWARRRFDVDFEIVHGVMHRGQPDFTLRQLEAAVAAYPAFALAALSQLVSLSGSLVLALMLAEGATNLDTAWRAATADEDWQAEQWGADADAAARQEARRQDFAAAARFLTLL